MKDFKEPKTIHIQPKHINIPTNVCDVSKFAFISPDNDRKYGYDSNGTPCISKPIQNPINVSYIPPKESPSITYVSPYSSFTPQDSSFVPKHNIFSPQTHNIIPLHNINISNRQEVSQNYEEQEAQRIKEANEAYAVQQAKIQQERELVIIANKLQQVKDFEATPVGIVTVKLQQAEEIYAAKVEQYKNIPHNFNYHENRVIAARNVDQAAKQVEVLKALKYKTEQEADQDRRQAVWEEEFRIQQAKEKQDIIDTQQARINPSKKEVEKIKSTVTKYNSDEVEKYSPQIKTILKQYKTDYEGFNKKITSEGIHLQALHKLSLKKLTSVDSHVVDLVFDLLRDNHLPSLKTLDLSDNPKSIGADQITKLTDSFLSKNNNLETLDISCVYPPPKGRGWYSWEQRGEHLVYDSYANLVTKDKLSPAFNKLILTVSTCPQPLCITIDSTTSQGGYTLDPKNSLITPANFLSQVNFRGSDISFKTTGSVMLEHMIRLCQNKKHDAEDFTWGITKCLTSKSEIDSLSTADIEYIKGTSQFPSKAVISLTKKLQVFLGVAEVLENSIISHDMLEHEGSFTALYGRDNWWGIGSRGLRPDEPTEKGVSKGGTKTQIFDSSCKHCEEIQFAHFLNVLSILDKNDVTTMANLNLSNSNMDDCDASILAKLIKQGNLPNLKNLDVSDNQITATGIGYLAKGLEVVIQDLKIVFEVVKGFSIDALKATMKQMLSIAHSNGISTKETLTTDETITHCIKGGINVGLNISWGVTKCLKTPAKYLTPKDVTFQDVLFDGMSNIKMFKPIITFYCITQNTFFSIVDEDFASCLTGLDSMLND